MKRKKLLSPLQSRQSRPWYSPIFWQPGTDYGYLCAGVLVAVIPVLIVYLIFQRYFVEGMAGAVKS